MSFSLVIRTTTNFIYLHRTVNSLIADGRLRYGHIIGQIGNVAGFRLFVRMEASMKKRRSASLVRSKPVFISHATKDRAIAQAVASILAQFNLTEDDVFCSSLEGMGIPIGKNFISFIRDQIQRPQLVILLLSKHYFESQFCVAELGASWAMGLEVFPLVVPPLTLDDVKAVLTGVQVGEINKAICIDELQRCITRVFHRRAPERWPDHRNAFLRKLRVALKHPARLSEPRLAKEPNTANTKRERDVKTLSRFMQLISLQVMDRFFEKAFIQHITDESLYFYEDVVGFVESAFFHLYDETALSLVKAFKEAWVRTHEYDVWFDPGKSGKVYVFRDLLMVSGIDSGTYSEGGRALKGFKAAVKQMYKAFNAMLSYIRSEYVEINVEAASSAAFKNWRKWEKESNTFFDTLKRRRKKR